MLREGGNLLWGVKAAPALAGDLFTTFRSSALFDLSRKVYEPGWTTHDRMADPRFVNLTAELGEPADLRLLPDSPCVDSGQCLPVTWPDPLKATDLKQPDLGAIPLGVDPWGIGVKGRLSLFTNAEQ